MTRGHPVDSPELTIRCFDGLTSELEGNITENIVPKMEVQGK